MNTEKKKVKKTSRSTSRSTIKPTPRAPKLIEEQVTITLADIHSNQRKTNGKLERIAKALEDLVDLLYREAKGGYDDEEDDNA